jgi:hypothetical protein
MGMFMLGFASAVFVAIAVSIYLIVKNRIHVC